MKACDTSVEYGNDAEVKLVKAYGRQLHEEDHSGGYETDSIVLHLKGRSYALLRASACSCYEAVYDGWTYTKTELLKWATEKVKGYGVDKSMAEWIQENIK